MDKEILLAEYHEVAEGMRFHSDLRWKLLGVAIPISGGLLALSIQYPGYQLQFYFFGLLTSSASALVEYRTQVMWHVFFNRAIEIEKILKIQGAFRGIQLHKKPWYLFDSTLAIRIVYLFLILYWARLFIMEIK